MVDSRDKGLAGEAAVKKFLIKETGLNWQRIPSSGALSAVHGLKGDLYIPQHMNTYCVEVKFYKDDHISSKLLTAPSGPFFQWWEQCLRQSFEVQKKPLLFFKFNRSKIFVATMNEPENVDNFLFVGSLGVYIMLAKDWLDNEETYFTI